MFSDVHVLTTTYQENKMQGNHNTISSSNISKKPFQICWPMPKAGNFTTIQSSVWSSSWIE
uniref:Uncharacterized protein n=1 Tax=Rhizophora mucronata TaxID=61149 RepID=A0A2P2Q7G1_RHIMU